MGLIGCRRLPLLGWAEELQIVHFKIRLRTYTLFCTNIYIDMQIFKHLQIKHFLLTWIQIQFFFSSGEDIKVICRGKFNLINHYFVIADDKKDYVELMIKFLLWYTHLGTKQFSCGLQKTPRGLVRKACPKGFRCTKRRKRRPAICIRSKNRPYDYHCLEIVNLDTIMLLTIFNISILFNIIGKGFRGPCSGYAPRPKPGPRPRPRPKPRPRPRPRPRPDGDRRTNKIFRPIPYG